jgi:superfamily II DNA helicase RecQ
MATKLDWLVAEIKTKVKRNFKNFHILQHSQRYCHSSEFIVEAWKACLYSSWLEKNKEDLIIGNYHSVSWPKYKEGLLSALQTNYNKRVIVASTALSMGVNFGDI